MSANGYENLTRLNDLYAYEYLCQTPSYISGLPSSNACMYNAVQESIGLYIYTDPSI